MSQTNTLPLLPLSASTVLDCDLKKLLRTNYTSIKTKLFEISEELKMRRVNDKESEVRVNQLITEKFEIKRMKEEEISLLTKVVENLKQENLQLQKEFDEKMKMHKEDKAAQNISINSSCKGIKSLKDEILALQLSKYSLEKKLKDQDHQLQLEIRGKNDTVKKMNDLQETVKDLQQQCQDMQARLEYLSDLVVKTEQMHQKLIGAGEHHKCVVANYQTLLNKTQRELTASKSKILQLKETNQKVQSVSTDDRSQNDCKKSNVVKELRSLHHQMEVEISATREQKKFLMSSLAESNHMLLTVQSKFDDVNQLNAGLQLEIDELKTEVEKVRMVVRLKDDELTKLKKNVDQEILERNKMETVLNEQIGLFETEISSMQLTIQAFDEAKEDIKNERLLQLEETVRELEKQRYKLQTTLEQLRRSGEDTSHRERIESQITLEHLKRSGEDTSHRKRSESRGETFQTERISQSESSNTQIDTSSIRKTSAENELVSLDVNDSHSVDLPLCEGTHDKKQNTFEVVSHNRCASINQIEEKIILQNERSLSETTKESSGQSKNASVETIGDVPSSLKRKLAAQNEEEIAYAKEKKNDPPDLNETLTASENIGEGIPRIELKLDTMADEKMGDSNSHVRDCSKKNPTCST